MDQAKLDQVLEGASEYDPGFLFHLLGSTLLQDRHFPQGGGAAEAGKGFFEKWKDEFRKIICKKGGVCDQFGKGIVSKKELPRLVAIAILAGSPTIGGVLVSETIAAYMALLVVQAGLGAYCSGFKEK